MSLQGARYQQSERKSSSAYCASIASRGKNHAWIIEYSANVNELVLP